MRRATIDGVVYCLMVVCAMIGVTAIAGILWMFAELHFLLRVYGPGILARLSG